MSGDWGPLLIAAAKRLADAGVASPRVDAELLAAEVAGIPRGRLLMADPPDTAQVARFRALVERRARREPLQHVLGTAAFWRSELSVGPGVFVPRPETELLVEWALQRLTTVSKPVVADLCAGSGAIGHAVATERPDATVYVVERYAEALSWLRHNMSDTVAIIVEGDATSPNTMVTCNGTCDAVLSNPPYIPLGAAAQMSPEVDADPATALYGGADGLEVIRPLIPRAWDLLRPGGVVGIEHDDTHGEIVPELLREAGFDEVTEHRDLAGRDRFATARRPMPQG